VSVRKPEFAAVKGWSRSASRAEVSARELVDEAISPPGRPARPAPRSATIAATMIRDLAPFVLVCSVAAAQAPCHDLLAITAIRQDLLVAFPVTGSSCVQVDQRGATSYREAAGSFTLQTVVPIASATKTLSAAVLMSLVDDGDLSLDDTVGHWLPEWNNGVRASITLRMCFTHTAGLPSTHPAVGDDSITLRAAAMQLANVPLSYAPGTAFLYGGVSMHVAGAVCEVAAGQSWNQLFQQRIATPLGMTATDHGAFGTRRTRASPAAHGPTSATSPRSWTC